MAEKWALQWKLEIICIVTVLVSAIVLLMSALTGGGLLAILAGFVTLVSSIGALVLGIMRFIYIASQMFFRITEREKKLWWNRMFCRRKYVIKQ